MRLCHTLLLSIKILFFCEDFPKSSFALNTIHNKLEPIVPEPGEFQSFDARTLERVYNAGDNFPKGLERGEQRQLPVAQISCAENVSVLALAQLCREGDAWRKRQVTDPDLDALSVVSRFLTCLSEAAILKMIPCPLDHRPPGPSRVPLISNHQRDSSIMAKLLNIAKTTDVPPGQAAAFTIEGQKIALFNVEGTYYAIGDTCTHRGGPLSEGDVLGVKVTCPWHGAEFDLRTGAVLGPPAQKSVPSYKVVVEGDDIKVEV